jgi:hypothetical protein
MGIVDDKDKPIENLYSPPRSSTAPGLMMLSKRHLFFGYEVPKGFISDGGSIPKPATLLIDRWGEALKAYILHDYQWSLADKGQFSYKQADKILYEYCIHLGINKNRAKAIYLGVRIGAKYRGNKG